MSVRGCVLGGGCLAGRLSHYLALTERERDALGELEQQERISKRGAVVLREHDSPRDLLILQKGWLYSFVLLGNGSRQITRLHFPGDLIGISSLASGKLAESVAAVTEVSLSPFGKDKLATLFRLHPRLAALVFSLTVAERVAMADRLASIGRTSARARVGQLLCEIFARLRIIGAGQESLHLPLTQEDIGDATGLTAVHVNRMMRGLVDEGFIERSGSRIRLLREDRLVAESGFIDRFARIDSSWFPDPTA